jgi:hypothetical protein
VERRCREVVFHAGVECKDHELSCKNIVAKSQELIAETNLTESSKVTAGSPGKLGYVIM